MMKLYSISEDCAPFFDTEHKAKEYYNDPKEINMGKAKQEVIGFEVYLQKATVKDVSGNFYKGLFKPGHLDTLVTIMEYEQVLYGKYKPCNKMFMNENLIYMETFE